MKILQCIYPVSNVHLGFQFGPVMNKAATIQPCVVVDHSLPSGLHLGEVLGQGGRNMFIASVVICISAFKEVHQVTEVLLGSGILLRREL